MKHKIDGLGTPRYPEYVWREAVQYDLGAHYRNKPKEFWELTPEEQSIRLAMLRDGIDVMKNWEQGDGPDPGNQDEYRESFLDIRLIYRRMPNKSGFRVHLFLYPNIYTRADERREIGGWILNGWHRPPAPSVLPIRQLLFKT